MSKIAWLHFDYITKGETENLAQITAGIHLAAENGAAYILSPELAVQGYHFTQQGKPYVIHTDLCALLQPVLQAAAKRRVWIFRPGCWRSMPLPCCIGKRGHHDTFKHAGYDSYRRL